MANNLLDFKNIISLIETHRENAYRKINAEHVLMCQEVGKYLSEKLENKQWGDKTIDLLAKYIKERYPTLKGFTRLGLYRMIRFYRTYRNNKIVSSLLKQISFALSDKPNATKNIISNKSGKK